MKTAIFLDTSDLYHRVKRKYKKKLDYGKLLALIQEDHEVVKAVAYGIQTTHEATGFISCLKRAGFITKFRKPEEIANGDRKIRRSTTNVELTVDVMTVLDRVDTIYLGSGNLEFLPLTRYITNQGKRCVLLSCLVPNEFSEEVWFPDALE